ncbi:MAG: ribosome biogenesis GTPase Der [Chloroflexi bacterium]|nr:ribosome biogenesis GTPase Der [Chloroflexota bacterium]|tara:strand:- start:4711 stop:6099 length:1389 start_codon:yes stop_codon:yes gene_type:complete
MTDNTKHPNDSLIALVGRSNVGKSALFNRLLKKNQSIVEDVIGTTRDLVEHEIEIDGQLVKIVDTGGWLELDDDMFQVAIRDSLHEVFQHASLILFVVDASMYPTALDYELVDVLRKNYDLSKVILVGNKSDKKESTFNINEYAKFGFADQILVSAYHSLNMHDLNDLISKKLNLQTSQEISMEESPFINLSIVGRPNVGKSSLLNSILGFDRVLVSDHAGTTRDAIDIAFEFDGNLFNLIDTAGIRRRGKVQKGIERKSVMQAQSAISRSDVTILLLDINDPYVAQDSHVASYALDSHKGLILALSKSDVAEDSDEVQITINQIRRKYRFVNWAPIVVTSALHNIGREELLQNAVKIAAQRKIRIETSELNRFINQAINENPPGLLHNRRLKIYYVTQAEINPPHFIFFVNDTSNIHFSYKRYLENKIRMQYGFDGTAIRMSFKDKNEQEAEHSELLEAVE